MFHIFALSAAVSLVTAITLWLVWAQDKRQVFVRSGAFAQIAGTFSIVGYAAWRSSDLALSGLGAGVMIVSLAATYTLLARGLVELDERRLPAKWQWLVFGAFTAVYFAIQSAKRPELAAAFTFVVMTLVGLYATAKLWRRGLPERIVGVCIALLGINSLGVEALGEPSVITHLTTATVLRLAIMLALGCAAAHRLQAGVQQLRYRAERLTENSLQGIVVASGVRLHYANPAALDMFGFSSLEAAQKAGPLSVFLPELRAKAYDDVVSLIRGAKNYQDVERKAVKTDGAEIHLRLSGWPVMWEGQPAVQVVVINDTARYEAARLLRAQLELQEKQQAAFAERSKSDLVQANVQLEQQVAERTHELAKASQAKVEFVANMSHEIRTPMNNVLGLLQLLQRTELGFIQSDYVKKAEGAAKSLMGLLSDVLDYSKIEAGKLVLSLQPFEMERLLSDLSSALTADHCEKPVEFIFDIDPQIPRVMVGDATRLLQVLVNLTANALKFTAQGEVVVRIVALASDNAKVTLRVSVIDSGAGIAPEHLDRIFDVSSQLQADGARRLTGPRLGLAICRRLLLLMGANLRVQSTPGKGSNFYFEVELPFETPQPLLTPRVLRTPLSVLLVDDNPTARECMAIMAIAQGWRVEVADSGAAAVAKVQQRVTEGAALYDILVVDWQLSTVGDMDGWQTLEHIQRICPPGEVPSAVMVSTLGREHLQQRLTQEQAMLKAYLVKPFTYDTFVSGITGVSNGVPALRVAPRPLYKEPVLPQSKPLQGLHVLVVEDNKLNQVFAKVQLVGAGARVAIAGNGAVGIEMVAAANQVPFDLVLMDMQMPVMDGCTATRAIRNLPGRRQHVPIIAMTANAMVSDRKACLEAGMNDHVGKPFDFAFLVQTILRYTRGGRAEAEAGVGVGVDPGSTAAPTVTEAGTNEKQFDVHNAIVLMGNDRELYGLILLTYLDQLRHFSDKLAAYLAAGDLASAQRALHTMKGTSTTVGALHMMRTAQAAELQIRNADAAVDYKVLASALRQVALETTHAMQPILAAVGTTNDPNRL